MYNDSFTPHVLWWLGSAICICLLASYICCDMSCKFGAGVQRKKTVLLHRHNLFLSNTNFLIAVISFVLLIVHQFFYNQSLLSGICRIVDYDIGAWKHLWFSTEAHCKFNIRFSVKNAKHTNTNIWDVELVLYFFTCEKLYDWNCLHYPILCWYMLTPSICYWTL